MAPSCLGRALSMRSTAPSLEVIAGLCGFLFLTIAYYLMTSKAGQPEVRRVRTKVTAKATVLFTTTCAFGMLISLLQSIGIIGMMTVDFPADLKGFLSFFQILLLDLDSFGFASWSFLSCAESWF